MRYRNTSHLLIALVLLATSAICRASKQPTAEAKRILSAQCQKELSDTYRTDGQEWIGPLTPGRIQEFTLSFYAGVRYRLAYASTQAQAIRYKLFDPDRNLLFSSEQHGNPTSWDFLFDCTTECSVVIQIPEGEAKPPQEAFALFRLAFRPSP